MKKLLRKYYRLVSGSDALVYLISIPTYLSMFWIIYKRLPIISSVNGICVTMRLTILSNSNGMWAIMSIWHDWKRLASDCCISDRCLRAWFHREVEIAYRRWTRSTFACGRVAATHLIWSRIFTNTRAHTACTSLSSTNRATEINPFNVSGKDCFSLNQNLNRTYAGNIINVNK